jgi:hypothetical protein
VYIIPVDGYEALGRTAATLGSAIQRCAPCSLPGRPIPAGMPYSAVERVTGVNDLAVQETI